MNNKYMLIIFQALFVLFALVAIVSVWKRRNEKLLSVRGLIFWILCWVTVIVVVLRPDFASTVAHTFGIGRGADFFVYISIALIFLLLFRLHIKIESINRDITKIVRKDALNAMKKAKTDVNDSHRESDGD